MGSPAKKWGPWNVEKLSLDDLRRYTQNFSEDNYIGKFQFGKLYRGKIRFYGKRIKHIVVKIWDVPSLCNYNLLRLMGEIVLFRHEKLTSHPGMVTVHGYCIEGDHVSVVYDFKPMDTVYNLICSDGFTWLQRIKVALGFARLLKFLHARNSLYEPFLIRNVHAGHIMLDEEYYPKLIDFSMATGGIFPDRTKYPIQYASGCYCYMDPSYAMTGKWTDKTDVFAFGVLLLGLISKRADYKECGKFCTHLLHEWAQSEYKSAQSDVVFTESDWALVHQNLAAEQVFCPTDGPKITKLAMQCVEYYPEDRPTMKQVVKDLMKLEVVKHHADFLERMLQDPDSD